ncbi:MAG: aminopeptidase P family protein [Nitrospinae bacterium]|nr:aminopeptidase P family protein [Nitrospinota bacterium]
MLEDRLEKVQERISSLQLDAFLILNYENIRYLTGFTGSASAILITQKGSFFLTDFRYRTQAEGEVKGFEIKEYKKQKKGIIDHLSSLWLKRVGFESLHISYAFFDALKKGLNGVELIPCVNIVEDIRVIKEPSEIEYIKKGGQIIEKVFLRINDIVKRGLKEKEICAEIGYQLRKGDSEGEPFDLIVTSGERSALPHGRAGDKVISDGDLIILDLGAKYMGYNSDITRTVVVGKPHKREEDIYKLVRLAQSRAIESISPGIMAKEIDAMTRNIISEGGYGDNFGHGTGHGVGLAVHESPKIAWDEEVIIEKGMVFTIEPGIYIPGWGGIRIEDMVVVTVDGCEVLTSGINREFMVI